MRNKGENNSHRSAKNYNHCIFFLIKVKRLPVSGPAAAKGEECKKHKIYVFCNLFLQDRGGGGMVLSLGTLCEKPFLCHDN